MNRETFRAAWFRLPMPRLDNVSKSKLPHEIRRGVNRSGGNVFVDELESKAQPKSTTA